MNNEMILKFKALKTLEKTIVLIVLFILGLIISTISPYLFFGSLLLIFIIFVGNNYDNAKKEIEAEYRKALEKIRNNPLDNDVYGLVLYLGRAHYKILEKGSISKTDQPIINDLTPILATAYERSLDILRGSPNNSSLRKKALETARLYYSTIRGGVNTIYDEQAINNDLSTIYGSDIDKSS